MKRQRAKEKLNSKYEMKLGERFISLPAKSYGKIFFSNSHSGVFFGAFTDAGILCNTGLRHSISSLPFTIRRTYFLAMK